jgi:hypothetical protein
MEAEMQLSYSCLNLAAALCACSAFADVVITPSPSGGDTPRIQQTIDNSTGEVRFKAGLYLLDGPIRLQPNRSYVGEGSFDPRYGSVLRQRRFGAAVFELPVLMSVTITGLTFDGAPGANAKGISASIPSAVLANSVIRGNHFLTSLAECIDAPMQSTRIENNFFGINGGAIGPMHRHIHSVTSAMDTNNNWIVGNHFSSAAGGESVLFEGGAKVHFVGNDFQANAASTTLRIYGMFQVVIDGNYFEQNAGDAQITLGNSSSGIADHIVRMENNYYHMGGLPGSGPNKFIVTVERSGVHLAQPDQTHVLIGYETGSHFSATARITPDDVFNAGYLRITSPSQAFWLQGDSVCVSRQVLGLSGCPQ